MDKSVFLDTAYIIALIITDDQFHKISLNTSRQIVAEKINLVTSELVLVEILDTLSKVKYRNEALITTKKLKQGITVIDTNKELLLKAYSLYEKRPDKEWGMTDCYSFVIMEKYNIKQVLTTDAHFEQAGFKILLK